MGLCKIPARAPYRARAVLLVVLLALFVVVLAKGSSGPAAADVPDVELTPIGTFSLPLYVTSPPGDPSRLFVVERGGRVRVVRNGTVLSTPFIDVSDETSTGGERGLLSIAFAPDYAVSGLVYSYFTLMSGELANADALLSATLSAQSRQSLKIVRRRGLLLRFRSDASATWTVTATLRRAATVRTARLQAARGRLAQKTFKAHTGSGTLRLRIPRARLAGMRTVVIRVHALVQAGGQSVQCSLLVCVSARRTIAR
jgi:hypothetical protein